MGHHHHHYPNILSLYTWDNAITKILTTIFIPFIKNIPTPTLIRCDDNPACRWYTWDNRENLCYLKSGRGFLRNRLEPKNFSFVPLSRHKVGDLATFTTLTT